ncbi:MAG: hypothetical protein J5482_05375 [Oscillospiraceae bacterium]|nr:hypothetical protein [Oscillospiraceae bacterium]
MVVLWIVGVLLALIVLLMLLRVGVRFSFGDEARLAVRVGPAALQILPGKAKKPSKEKKEKQKPETEAKEKKQPFKPTFAEIRSAVPALWTALKNGLRRTRRAVRIDPMRLSVTLAGDDPAQVAQMYGWAEGVMWTLMPRLEELVHMPDPRIHLNVDYQRRQSRAEGEVGLSLRVGDGVLIALAFGIPLLRWYLALRKSREKTKQETAEELTVKENKDEHE